MGHVRRTLAGAACAGLLMSPVTGAAQPVWFDLAVPGSIEEMLGTANRSLEGPHLLRRLIDVFHDRTGTIANPAQAAGAFRDCLADVQGLRDRWRAVEWAAGEVSLRAAASADGRRVLEQFLDRFDLRLAAGGDDPRVAPSGAEARREAEETDDEERRAVCGIGDGWGSAEIERSLNAGRAIAWDVPSFDVSLPLSPRIWLQVLYGDDPGGEAAELASERAADLLGRLVTNSRAARFYAGLAALDDSTLTWLQANPRVLARIANEHLTAFAQYGAGLRVRDGAVRAPGGAAFWEALVGVPVTEPERFVDRLFASEQAANAYDLVARLPETSRRFVTGAGQPDARDWRRGLALLGRVMETLPLPAPRFAERADARDPDRVFTPRPGLRSGDRLNENICNLPDDEATIVAWELRPAGEIAAGWPGPRFRWGACGPFSCTRPGHSNMMDAMDRVYARGQPEYVCQVEIRLRIELDGSVVPQAGDTGRGGIQWPAALYRLGYPLTDGQQDARRFIRR